MEEWRNGVMEEWSNEIRTEDGAGDDPLLFWLLFLPVLPYSNTPVSYKSAVTFLSLSAVLPVPRYNRRDEGPCSQR